MNEISDILSINRTNTIVSRLTKPILESIREIET